MADCCGDSGLEEQNNIDHVGSSATTLSPLGASVLVLYALEIYNLKYLREGSL